MPIISNTSPVLNLAIIGRLDLLKLQFGTVFIPQAVLQELRLEEDLPGTPAIRQAIDSGWLVVQGITNVPLVQALKRELDAGESEAIALALEQSADWVLLDEREGRRVAKTFGLNVVGIIGVLLRAEKQSQIEAFEQEITALKTQAGFWINPALLADIRKR